MQKNRLPEGGRIDRSQPLKFRFNGKRYDCGSKLGYVQANVRFGLRHPEVGDGLRTFLRDIQNES